MPTLSASVFDLVDRIAAADTAEGVWDTYLHASREVGLCYGIACYLPTTKDSPFQILAQRLPPGWLEEYYDEGMEAGDLLAERARLSPQSFSWRMDDWADADLTPIQRRWRDHNMQVGILGGLSIQDFRRDENMLLVLGGPDGPMHTHDRLTLIFAGQEAAQRLREMAVATPMAYAPLSRRERECLQWAAAGKTDWEIGRILSLSDKTVNVYIERAKAKYGVKTRAQAMVLALRSGVIAA